MRFVHPMQERGRTVKKRILVGIGLAFLLILGLGGTASAQYPRVTIDSVQFVPMDSLLVADTLTVTAGRATLEDSRYFHQVGVSGGWGDTVTVTGIVMVRPRVLSQGTRWATYIQDTSRKAWSGVNFLTADTTGEWSGVGITSTDTGYVIRATGWVDEYPRNSLGGATEMWFIASSPIEILNVGARPTPVDVRVSDLGTGANGTKNFPAKAVYSTGEKWEGVYVVLRDLTVSSRVSQTSGRTYWAVQDPAGNVIAVNDQSRYFRTDNITLDSSFSPPPVGTFLEYIRGIVTTTSGTYSILPLYPGDIKTGIGPPVVNSSFADRQSPTFPGPTNAVTVKVAAVPLTPAAPKVNAVAVKYSVNNDPYQQLSMTKVVDSLYSATIPAQPAGSVVRYFFLASNDSGKSTIAPDTSSNLYFYRVISGSPKISDVQFTVLKNGNSGLQNLPVTLSGVVMADTTDIPGVKNLDGSTNPSRLFIQDGTAPWSGIWMAGPHVSTLRRGDNVTATGTVEDVAILSSAGTTRIYETSVTKNGTATPYPPVVVQTSAFSLMANGDTTAERWESMLVEFRNVKITNDDPDNNSRRYREFMVDDGSGPMRVDDDGDNSYSINPADTARGKQILKLGWRIGTLRGIMSQTAGDYKLEPRKNDDFANIVTSVEMTQDRSVTPRSFSLSQNYPNPFNPSTLIGYDLARSADVSLKVFNILGQQVLELVNEVQPAGRYSVRFDASSLPSGMYFYRLRAGKFSSVRSMMLIK